MSPTPQVLLSVRPAFADALFRGTKTVELRRVCPRVRAGDVLLVYETVPTRAIVGSLRVVGVVSAEPEMLWQVVGPQSGIHREAFLEYLNGCEFGHAIRVDEPRRFRAPVGLLQLRRLSRNFHPPQSFRYLDPKRAAHRRLLQACA